MQLRKKLHQGGGGDDGSGGGRGSGCDDNVGDLITIIVDCGEMIS